MIVSALIVFPSLVVLAWRHRPGHPLDEPASRPRLATWGAIGRPLTTEENDALDRQAELGDDDDDDDDEDDDEEDYDDDEEDETEEGDDGVDEPSDVVAGLEPDSPTDRPPDPAIDDIPG
jgi:hypothetical protein